MGFMEGEKRFLTYSGVGQGRNLAARRKKACSNCVGKEGLLTCVDHARRKREKRHLSAAKK